MDMIIGLIVVALILFFFEVFVPGGILAIFGGILMLGAVYLTWEEFGVARAITVGIACIGISLIMLGLELLFLKKMGVGKKFFLSSSQKDYKSDYVRAEVSVVGKTGEAITTMAPTGTVIVDGKKYEGFSQDGYMPRGSTVQVVQKESFRLIVKKVD